MPFGRVGRVGLSGPERTLPGRYRVRPSRKREGEERKTESIGDARGYMLLLLRRWLLDRGLYFSIHQSDIVAELLDGI